MRRKIGEAKVVRINKRLESIKLLYDLIFENKSSEVNLKEYKENINLSNDEKELVLCCKKIANLIKYFEQKSKENQKLEIFSDTAIRLKEVFIQIVELIKDEFRTVRNRNSRVPQLNI